MKFYDLWQSCNLALSARTATLYRGKIQRLLYWNESSAAVSDDSDFPNKTGLSRGPVCEFHLCNYETKTWILYLIHKKKFVGMCACMLTYSSRIGKTICPKRSVLITSKQKRIFGTLKVRENFMGSSPREDDSYSSETNTIVRKSALGSSSYENVFCGRTLETTGGRTQLRSKLFFRRWDCSNRDCNPKERVLCSSTR